MRDVTKIRAIWNAIFVADAGAVWHGDDMKTNLQIVGGAEINSLAISEDGAAVLIASNGSPIAISNAEGLIRLLLKTSIAEQILAEAK